MRDAMAAINDFHEQVIGMDPTMDYGFPENRNVKISKVGLDLMAMAEVLQEQLRDPDHDPRWRRAHLMIEELGELVLAMGEANELSALDAMADLVYVVLGT